MKRRIFTRRNRIRIAKRKYKLCKYILDNSNTIVNLNWSEDYDNYLYWRNKLLKLKL